jgi:arachidonate 15-lipoxygenase
MTYYLPNADPNPADRTQQLKEARRHYSFNLKKFADISPQLEYPMANEVPLEENSLTKEDWVFSVASILLRIQANQALYDSEIQRGSICKLVWYVRLYKLLSIPEQRGYVEKLYKAILAGIQFVVKLSGRTPKSEDLKFDVERQKIAQVENRLVSMVNDAQKQAAKLVPDRLTAQNHAPLSFKNYRDLFQIIYLPSVVPHVLEDREFAAQRVAGANPLVIERLTAIPDNFPITEAQYQAVMGAADSLELSLQAGRLYVADYKVLEDIVTGTFPEGQKFLCKPIALFAMEAGDCPGRRLIPVAIQCNQVPSAQNPIFIPPALNASDSERWGWQIAKLMVQIADGNYHELISHLGRTHLFMEPITIATHRQLATNHPLSALLVPHCEGTLFINEAAVKGLMNPKGTVDKVLSGTLESSLQLSVKGAKEFPFSFNRSFLPATLEARGVDDPTLLPDYPYRDDALLIWAAIRDWVSDYLNLFYATDADVEQDQELQNWLAELVDRQGGQMVDIGQIDDGNNNPRIRTVAYLIEMVTQIIFTSSAQHAAVNFPQSSKMTYMPNMPLAGYQDTPQSGDDLSKADFLKVLPSLPQSEAQMNMTYLLGSVYYTKLGHYESGHFTDSRIAQPLQNFMNQLHHIELVINQRNESRVSYYDVLKPSKIPQSVNI